MKPKVISLLIIFAGIIIIAIISDLIKSWAGDVKGEQQPSKSAQHTKSIKNDTPMSPTPPKRDGNRVGDTGITFEEDAKIAPGPPGNIWLSKESGKNVVNWQGTRLDIISGYKIYRRCHEESWSFIGRTQAVGDNAGFYVFKDSIGDTCQYAVSSMDIRGNEGQKELAKLNRD